MKYFKLYDIGFSNFMDMIPKAQAITEKTGKLDHTKTKIYCAAKHKATNKRLAE